MGPKKPKKSKAELEAERLAKEEEDRKQVNLYKMFNQKFQKFLLYMEFNTRWN